MLQWFAKRLNEVQKVKRDERGFTLIELLVVVIIIGILAAIAIPTFLNQRQNAWEAAAKSSVRNAVTNAESFATNNNGSYANLTEAAIDAGISQTTVDTRLGAGPTATNFCVQGANTNGGRTFSYSKTGANADTIVPNACP